MCFHERNDARPLSRHLENPNSLVFLVDEERYPPVYERSEIKEWRKQNLISQELLKSHSTGHYPSLHGVSQTTEIAKETFDSDMFWMDRNTVPTIGDYFRAVQYQTYYKGKWHISYEDIIIPCTHKGLSSYNPITGVPDKKREELYGRADRLNNFRFSGWIGPEPHGKDPRNSGSSASLEVSGRDEVYAAEAVELIESLNRQKTLTRTRSSFYDNDCYFHIRP